MTPLEALVELTNMGVSEKRIKETQVGALPALYDIILEECGAPENWVHLLTGTPCDSELRWHSGGSIYICDDHDARVRRDA